MEEIEVPVEHAQEHIHHEAAHAKEGWVQQVALSSAVFAVLAAIAALAAGHASNEAVSYEIRASQQWSYYQAKGIKSDIAALKSDVLTAMGHPLPEKDADRQDKLTEDKKKALEQATEFERERDQELAVHKKLSPAVTFFQITIAVGAVAVLTRRRRFFIASLASAAVGVGFFAAGILKMFVH